MMTTEKGRKYITEKEEDNRRIKEEAAQKREARIARSPIRSSAQEPASENSQAPAQESLRGGGAPPTPRRNTSTPASGQAGPIATAASMSPRMRPASGTGASQCPHIAEGDGEDYWVQTGTQWIRIHQIPRSSLFTPSGTVEGPKTTTLTSQRSTIMEGTGEVLEDNWHDPNDAHRAIAGPSWVGRTVFYVRERDRPASNSSELHTQDANDEHEEPQDRKPKGDDANKCDMDWEQRAQEEQHEEQRRERHTDEDEEPARKKARPPNNIEEVDWNRQKLKKHMIIEIYSPPRVVLVAAKCGFEAGWSVDKIVNDQKGRSWDLDQPRNRRRLVRHIRVE